MPTETSEAMITIPFRHLTRTFVAATLVAISSASAHATLVNVPLGPSSAKISYTALVLGVFPLSGRFQRFSGAITTDPADPATCEIHVQVEIASLEMADVARTAQALGPSLLDAAHYPTMRFDGNCNSKGISGLLLLHGVSGTLHFSERRDANTIAATTTVQRQDYGITGMPGLLGQRVLIHLSIPLPGFLRPSLLHRAFQENTASRHR